MSQFAGGRLSVRKGGTARHSPFAGYAKGVFIAYESSVHEVFNLLMTEGMEAEAGLPAFFILLPVRPAP